MRSRGSITGRHAPAAGAWSMTTPSLGIGCASPAPSHRGGASVPRRRRPRGGGHDERRRPSWRCPRGHGPPGGHDGGPGGNGRFPCLSLGGHPMDPCEPLVANRGGGPLQHALQSPRMPRASLDSYQASFGLTHRRQGRRACLQRLSWIKTTVGWPSRRMSGEGLGSPALPPTPPPQEGLQPPRPLPRESRVAASVSWGCSARRGPGPRRPLHTVPRSCPSLALFPLMGGARPRDSACPTPARDPASPRTSRWASSCSRRPRGWTCPPGGPGPPS